MVRCTHNGRLKRPAEHGTRNTESCFVFRVLEIDQLVQSLVAEHGTRIRSYTEQFRILEIDQPNQLLVAEHGTRIFLPKGKVPPRVKRGEAPVPGPVWWDDS